MFRLANQFDTVRDQTLRLGVTPPVRNILTHLVHILNDLDLNMIDKLTILVFPPSRRLCLPQVAQV